MIRDLTGDGLDGEPAYVPDGWNDTETDYERDASIDEVFRRRVEEHPDDPAVELGDRVLTYRQLNAAAEAVGRTLGSLVDGPDACIGVLAERSIDAVIAFLGVLRAGAAYVPLDPCHPAVRRRFMVEDTRARAILVQANLVERGSDMTNIPILPLTTDDAVAIVEEQTTPLRGASAESLAYVMYTSGSSGRPKGVAIEHRGVLRYVRGAHALLPEPGEGVLLVNQLGFDASTYEIWAALLNGARLVVHPAGRADPRAIAQTIERHGVKVAFFATGLFHQMVDGALGALGGLRLVIAGGDVLSPAHARALRQAHPTCRLVNAYGPTETTVSASFHEVTSVQEGQRIPIGHPLHNTTLYVLNGDMRPVPLGERGELYVGGDGIARGYLNLPDVTARHFVADPFASRAGGRLYRTGDQVCLREDGELDFLGRLDDQIKIRGYRIEPGEIEAVLSGHPLVRQAVVVPREEVEGHPRLVAYVSAEPQTDTASLREFAGDRLPDYMVPSAWVVLDEIPLTENGKVDRGALPAPQISGDGRPPVTETEIAVAEAWSEVLHADRVTADDDFFECGGDSLLALQLLSRLRATLGVELPLDTVFDDRRVAAIARRAEDMLRSGPTVELLPLPVLTSRERTGSTPASAAQAQACFLSELADGEIPYQAQAIIWFDGELDHEALCRALNALVERHEIFRTTFPRERGLWMQQVHAFRPFSLETIDVRSAASPEREVEAIARRTFRRKIGIETLPLIHWTLIRLADDRHALLQVEHHVVHDGWSFATALGEIAHLYLAFVRGEANTLPSPTTQYRDFSEWQREFVDSERGVAQMSYWEKRLADLPPAPELPSDRPRPVRQSFRGDSLRDGLPANLVDDVRRTAVDLGCTPYILMLSAFFVWLHRYSGETDVVIGSGLANRRIAGTEALIGMLVNTVSLRADLGGDPTVRDFVSQVRSLCLDAFAHQELPFEQVVKRLAPKRRSDHAPIYQHLFSFHDSPLPDLHLPGLVITPHDTLGNGSAKADVNVVVINRRGHSATPRAAGDEDMTIVWEYATDLFEHATAERMLSHYVTTLTEMVASIDKPISTLVLTTDSERTALVQTAGNFSPYERDSSIVELFQARVKEAPSATAIVGENSETTYRDLDVASTRLARRLVEEGVGKATCVAVADDRSPSMIVALLGVLKAGAAYVGVDPSIPRARFERIARDACISVACASQASASWFDGSNVKVIRTDESNAGNELEADEAETPLAPDIGPLDSAYVCFTSGSTGEPKGVEISHRGVVRLVRGADYVDLGPNEVLLAYAPLSFDASTFEIWGALLNGGRLALAPPGPLSTAELAEILTRHQVTTAWFTSAIFHQMVDHELATLSTVRQILAGGDVLSPTHVDRLLRALPEGAVVVNGYGPTEGTTFTCCHRMTAGTMVDGPIPIGRPIANTSAHIVDVTGEPVPVGMIGELWAGGDGVALGYLGRPDLTAERFVPDRFGGHASGWLYKTGDLARRRPDGVIEFLGRADRQVKLRGFRVEPAETEAALLRHANVRQAHVVAREFGPDDKRLVAYLIGTRAGDDTKDDPRPSDASMGDFLSGVLPRHMVPTAYVWLDEFPSTPNGKIAENRLPPPPSKWFTEGCGQPPISPATTLSSTGRGPSPLERTLISLWQEVTGVRDVGLHDDFFDLGGHSLLAVQLFAAIERSTGARLPLTTIFEAPTVAELAVVLRSDGWGAGGESLVPLRTSGSRPPLFAVTAGDGNVVGFGPLARRLSAEQPFYVLHPYGLDSRALRHRTVASMARHYVSQILTVQATGPYLLGGRCFGALVAYEMARQLEAAGHQVALLMAIDSLGPLWEARHLANGLPYDEVMNLARVQAGLSGTSSRELFSDKRAADDFVAWLSEPVTAYDGYEVSRYLYAAYVVRPDLQSAYPLPDGGHAGLLHWSWVGGRTEMGMNPALLAPPSPDALRARTSADPRRLSRPRRAGSRVLDWIDMASRGVIPPLATRRAARLLEIASLNVLEYRAGRCAAPVVLIRSEDDEQDEQQGQLARWFGVETGGVEVHHVRGSHHGMLREPDVVSLARCLDDCIDRALARG